MPTEHHLPWLIVSWSSRPWVDWNCKFFDSAIYGNREKALVEAKRFAEEKLKEGWVPVRLLEAKMINVQGQTDPGGAFNSIEVQREINYDKGVKGYD